MKCRLLPITEGIDAQTDSFPLLLEGFEVSSHTLVKFVCTDSRLSIVGSDVVTCLPNGTWSGPYPTECGKSRTLHLGAATVLLFIHAEFSLSFGMS